MDLDETMTTSTSSTPSALQDTTEISEAFEDDNLFPDPASSSGAGDTGDTDHPRTPPANDHLNAAAPGELSPPRSQPQSQSNEGQESGPRTRSAAAAAGSSITNSSHAGANIAVTRSAARTTAADGQAQDGGVSQPPGNERDERPGWGWKNKKAQEEMQRAWDTIIDRDYSLKEYGDVVLLGKAQLAQQ